MEPDPHEKKENPSFSDQSPTRGLEPPERQAEIDHTTILGEYTVESVGGILGIWHRDGEDADAASFSRMSAALRHRGPDGEGRKSLGPLAFAQQHLFVTPEETGRLLPLASESGNLIVMDGRLDDREELIGALGLAPDTPDAPCVLAAYEAWSDRFAERLNGDFAVAIYDVMAQRVVLARDAIGVRPLYYFYDDRLLVFASEIKAVLAHSRVPTAASDDGLADFMLLGTRPVDRQDVTCFAGVWSVVPAHLVIVSSAQLVSRRYWDFDRGLTVRLRSFEEYAEAYGEHFERAVKRRARSTRPVAISVSGGFDSSSVFSQFERLRRTDTPGIPPAVGISYFGRQGSDADEVRYLTDIEREHGIAIERFAIEPLQGLVNGAFEEVHAIEAPFLDCMWGVTRELHSRAAARGARLMLTGHWGDQVLFSSAYLADLFGDLRWGTIREHLRAYRRWFGDHEARVFARRFIVDTGRRHLPSAVLPAAKWIRRRVARPDRTKPWFTEQFLEKGLRFADQPVQFGGGFHSAHARSIYLEARSKYHVHCLEWNNKVAALYGMTTAFPFLDRDLVQFLMAVPGDIQNRYGVPRALAREGMRGVLPDSIRARTWKADFSAVANVGVTGDAKTIRRALGPNALSVRRDYVDGRALSGAVERLTGGGRDDCLESWDVADLFGLELWLQVFFGTEGRVPAPAGASPEPQEQLA